MAENTAKRARTKEKLKTALIALCNEKGFYDVTIWDICERAGLYRSTFYRYYETKDDVLREIEHEYIEATRALTPTLWNFHAGSSPEELEQYRRELTADMEYHKAHNAICRFLLSPAGDIYFYNRMLESIGQQLRKNFEKYGAKDVKTSAYLITFFASGFVSTIEEWLKKTIAPKMRLQVFF